MLPRRATERKTTDVLKNNARTHLVDLANEGRLWTGAGLAPTFQQGRAAWQRRVNSFLLAAFGRAEDDQFRAVRSVRTQIEVLEDLNQRLDELHLRRGYRGWSGR